MHIPIFILLIACFVSSQTTPHELRVPDAPENIRVRTTSTSATLWWDPPSDPDVLVRGYTVEYGIAAPNRRIIIEGANTNSFTINRLEPNSTYVFSVSAYNEAEGEDGQKVLLSGTTQADGGDPGDALWPPIAVRAQAYENGNVEVTWEDSNPHGREHNMVQPTHMRHYIVQYGIYQSENLQKVRSNSKHAKLTGLLPGKEYEIAVKVVEMNGKESPWSIRDIVLTPTDKTKAISRYDWICEFEKDMCGMSNGDGKQWIRTRDKGTSILVVDPMPSKYRFATLMTPSFNMQTSNSLCLQFNHYAKQNKQGQLYIEIRDEKTSAKKELLRLSAYDIPEEDWQTITIPMRRQKHTFKIFFEVSWKTDGSWLSLDNIHVSSGACPTHHNTIESIDSETEIDLLVPVESSLNSDPRVFRAKGIDNLPAIGIQRGAEIAVPYRLYLPRKFFRRFSILLAVKPMDRRGGYLFSVVNPYDTAVDVGLLLEPAENDQTNISLIYGADDASSTTRAVASFVVPQFVQQWTQIALEVEEHTVTLYYKCVRFAAKRIHTLPQLSMDDAHKLYIGSAGPILSSGFEGAIQELKLIDDPAEAAKQCDELWWKRRKLQKMKQRKGDEGSGSEQFKDQESADHATVMKMEMPPAPAPPPPYTEKLSSGSHGIQGPRGERGEPGQPGVCMQQCRDGLPGSNGQQGPQGIQGPPGPPGAAGAPGAGGGYDESGMRSMPGPMGSPGLPGSQGPQGLQGPRGEAGLPGRDGRDYQGLTEEDIERIARHPSAKGEKGECEQQIVSAASASEGELPPYDSQRHRHTTKGEKGDRGDSGPSGPPGPQGPPGPAGFGVAGVSAGGVQVFPTTVELFAVARSAHIGTLAFATSSQQLYIKVNNGWKEVLLGAFHPVLQQRQSVPIVLDSDFPGQHLEYWEAPTTEKQMVPSPEYHRDTPIPPVAHPAPSQTETVIHQHKDKVIHMIALNKPLDGNMHGMRGADLLCYREARLAGFTTTFRAMLSSNVQDVLRIVHNVDMDTPIVNLRGERLYTSWRSLLNEGERTSAPIYSFNRKDILNDDSWPNKLVWHASKDGGVRAGEYCEGWRRNYDTRTAHAGDLRATGGLFADSVEMDCSQKLVVLCVENMSKYHGDKILRKKRPSDLVW